MARRKGSGRAKRASGAKGRKGGAKKGAKGRRGGSRKGKARPRAGSSDD